ncbi:ATP-dependent DNA helicase RecQ [uncultured Desulfatiglans sp.]|nr:ATP-dependent DNA helicase RecQ [uncultured Desulfatiglans sp.]
MTPYDILKRYYGYGEFREHQLEIIQTVMGGKDAFVLMPTGSGKSLCYQIPSVLREGVGIVVSPLIALMQDQVEAMLQIGIRAECLNSTLSDEQAARAQLRIRRGEADILYVAPERFLLEGFRAFLAEMPIALFAIDEAHCVSQWGHDFRPDYLRIAEVTGAFPGVPRMALTATADEITRKDIFEKLQLGDAQSFISSFDRPNILYRVQLKEEPRRQLLGFLKKEHAGDAGLVYVRTRRSAEETAVWLQEEGVNALPYHAGLEGDVRRRHLERFRKEEGIVIVGTVAFGMGIDKPDVRFVAHLDPPASMEAYYQETGRAGRDGEPADAWMLYSLGDVVARRRLLENSEGDEAFKAIQRKKLETLLTYCETAECRRRFLLRYFGESYPEDCSNCDNCLDVAETWDGTVPAQMALSCVYRTGQRFGVVHLTDVLKGSLSDKVKKFGHDRIKTFGVGKDLSEKEWRSIFRQLLAAGYLIPDRGVHPGLRLSEKSWGVLKGEVKIRFRRDLRRQERSQASKTSSRVSERARIDASLQDAGVRSLYEKLQGLRMRTAKSMKLPPFFIFSNATLQEMATRKPVNETALREISGVGEKKAERFGGAFLDVIREHLGEEGAGRRGEREAGRTIDAKAEDGTEAEERKSRILDLLREGKLDSKEIAEQVGVSPPTVWAFKAHMTMGTYDGAALVEKARDSTGPEPHPPPEVVDHVRKKIRSLGDFKAVKRFYSGDSDLCRYALRIAEEVLSAKAEAEAESPIEAIRRGHPNAYEKWSPEEDERLRREYASGTDIQAMAEAHARKPGAIRSRLKKIGLV